MSLTISVVVPVYGGADSLSLLCERVEQQLVPITKQFEIIFVDDRCPHDSWKEIERLKTKHPYVVGVRLSRNFGQHIAITAGLAQAKGDYVIVMDCDLQDPPEYIPAMYAKIQEGHDLVLARRAKRSHSPFRLLAAKTYFYLLGVLTEERVDGSYGSLSMLSRKVVNAFLEFSERERHYLFILRWMGFTIGTIEYPHAERHSGQSSYTLRRLMRHAISGIFFQATVLLRGIVAVGLTFAAFGLLMAAYFIAQYFTSGAVEGWTSIVVLMLVCTGVILTSLGVIGLYIGKIFDQTKARPLYFIDQTLPRESVW